jgi:hypothetical protein
MGDTLLTIEYFYMSMEDAITFHAALTDQYTTDNEGNFQIPCDIGNIVEVSFVFNGNAFPISPLDFIGPSIPTRRGLDNGVCMSNIVGRWGNWENTWSLGSGFLRNVTLPNNPYSEGD